MCIFCRLKEVKEGHEEDLHALLPERKKEIRDKPNSIYPEQLIQVARFLSEMTYRDEDVETAVATVNTEEQAVEFLTYLWAKHEQLKRDNRALRNAGKILDTLARFRVAASLQPGRA